MNYKEKSDFAFSLHSRNKLKEAEELYIQLLDIMPEDVNILNLYGLLCISKSDFEKAITLLSKAVVLKDSAYIISNLAKAYLSAGELKNAIRLFEMALEKEKNDDLYYSLAIAYKKSGNIQQAIKAYKAAYDFNPKNYNVCYNLALLYKDCNDYLSAIDIANKCLAIYPDSEEIYSLLSSLYEYLNDIPSAVEALEKAVKINPKQYLYYFNLGVLYSKIGDKEKSAANYKKVIELNPVNIEAYVNLCSMYKSTDKNNALNYILKAYSICPDEKNVLLNLAQLYRDLYKNDESIKILEKLISLDNKCHEAYSLLAVNYMDTSLYSLALENYNKAILYSNQEDLNYLHGKSTALKYLGNFEESKKILEYVVQKNPDLVQSAVSLGMLYLKEKDFYKGMRLYSKRSLDTNFANLFQNKIWSENTDLIGKKVLVYSDCGLGDTIMFSRYLSILSQSAQKVILQTDKELISVLSASFPYVEIIPKSCKYDDYDIVIPIMNLPLALDLDFNKIPFSDGYIKADKDKYSQLQLFKTDKLKIGICTQGNKRIFKNRSIPDNIAQDLFNMDNCIFYSFKNEFDNISSVISLQNYIKDYSDTASLLLNMDLLITIDSSIVHMSGALGVKTFLLLPHTPEWRWFDDNKNTIWYNSVRIFKQKKIADWQTVISEVKNELSVL